MSAARRVAILGTGSEVGKSIVATALCRCLSDAGISTAPFKSQNMSNNSGVTPEGLEMGRAQIVQAEAARIPPHVDMNPVLLKPTGEKGAQVVLHGKVHDNLSAVDYHQKKDFFFSHACRAFENLADRFDAVVLEGAGSCAEVNLMDSDIVNFRMAEYAGADVVIVADIHRGGVFAQIVGTMECLPHKYRDRVKGFVINRFRGDLALFRDAAAWLEERTGRKIFGVLPWYSHFKIDAEDSVELENTPSLKSVTRRDRAVGIIRLPHISNFTDFHPLAVLGGLETVFIDLPVDLSGLRAVILPGSKNTRSDTQWLKKSGIAGQIQQFSNSGGHVLGICGGYQMLGQSIEDPEGVEGPAGTTGGLGLLDVKTVLRREKTTTLSAFLWGDTRGEGYEIHMGDTVRGAAEPLFDVLSRNTTPADDHDGSVSGDGRTAGTYMHGLFDSPPILLKWLETVGLHGFEPQLEPGGDVTAKETAYRQLKAHFEKYIDPFSIVPG